MLVPRGPRGGRAGRKITLIDEQVSMGALFAAYDANQDHQLDVHEAVELLKATCTEMGITAEWVTPQWVAQQFRAAGATPRPDAVDEEITVGQDEFQSFCSSIMYFLSALGGVSECLTCPIRLLEVFLDGFKGLPLIVVIGFLSHVFFKHFPPSRVNRGNRSGLEDCFLVFIRLVLWPSCSLS